jgi:hypothetical protein
MRLQLKCEDDELKLRGKDEGQRMKDKRMEDQG